MIRLMSVFTCCLIGLYRATPLVGADDRPTDPLCGVHCLYLALRGLDLDVGDHATFVESFGSVDARGVSLGELAKVAERHGAKTLAVRTTFENLLKRESRFACIAHVDDNHYLNIVSVEPELVLVHDPPVSARVARDLLGQRWSGFALLIARQELIAEEDLMSGAWPASPVMLMIIGLAITAICLWMLPRSRRQP